MFIENNPARCAALEALKGKTARDIQIIQGEANATLEALVSRRPWDQKDRSKSRAVVFLDPYALEVDWSTLQSLATTCVMDVWYLFPLEAVLRQLSRKISGVGVKAPKLDRMLSPAWRDLYALHPPDPEERADMFDVRPIEERQREANAAQVEEWFRGELAKIFASAIRKPQDVFAFPMCKQSVAAGHRSCSELHEIRQTGAETGISS